VLKAIQLSFWKTIVQKCVENNGCGRSMLERRKKFDLRKLGENQKIITRFRAEAAGETDVPLLKRSTGL